jgi:hypothetical protein
VNKLFGVGIVGTLVLFIALWAMARSKEAEANANATGSTTVVAIAPTTLPTTPIAPTAPAPAIAAGAAGDHGTCVKLSDVCTTSQQKVDVADCERQLADARKVSGGNNVDRAHLCMNDAQTCAAATGCLSGTLGTGTLGEYLKGFGSALSH